MLKKMSSHNKKISTRFLRIKKFYKPSYASEKEGVTLTIFQTTKINIDGIHLNSYLYVHLDNSSTEGIVKKIFFSINPQNNNDLEKVRSLNFLSKFKRLIFHKHYLNSKYKCIPDGKRVHRYIFDFKDTDVKIDDLNNRDIVFKFNKIPFVSIYKLNSVKRTEKYNPKNKLYQNDFYMDIYLEVEE